MSPQLTAFAAPEGRGPAAGQAPSSLRSRVHHAGSNWIAASVT